MSLLSKVGYFSERVMTKCRQNVLGCICIRTCDPATRSTLHFNTFLLASRPFSKLNLKFFDVTMIEIRKKDRHNKKLSTPDRDSLKRTKRQTAELKRDKCSRGCVLYIKISLLIMYIWWERKVEERAGNVLNI